MRGTWVWLLLLAAGAVCVVNVADGRSIASAKALRQKRDATRQSRQADIESVKAKQAAVRRKADGQSKDKVDAGSGDFGTDEVAKGRRQVGSSSRLRRIFGKAERRARGEEEIDEGKLVDLLLAMNNLLTMQKSMSAAQTAEQNAEKLRRRGLASEFGEQDEDMQKTSTSKASERVKKARRGRKKKEEPPPKTPAPPRAAPEPKAPSGAEENIVSSHAPTAKPAKKATREEHAAHKAPQKSAAASQGPDDLELALRERERRRNALRGSSKILASSSTMVSVNPPHARLARLRKARAAVAAALPQFMRQPAAFFFGGGVNMNAKREELRARGSQSNVDKRARIDQLRASAAAQRSTAEDATNT